jgi:hypothetical protein
MTDVTSSFVVGTPLSGSWQTTANPVPIEVTNDQQNLV